MKKYKYITVHEPGQVWNKKPVYHITNTRSGDVLGSIVYYPAWRQFVFNANASAIFSFECLEDIIDSMNLINQGKWTA
jgi:hypothetical protein